MNLACVECGGFLPPRRRKYCSDLCKLRRDRRTENVKKRGFDYPVSVADQACSDCGQILAAEQFSRDKSKRTGLNSICKTCAAVRHTEYRATSKGKIRENHLVKSYNLTGKEYEEILASQGGVCAICGQPPIHKRLAVDHDHATKLIRGLLCSFCNLRVVGKHRDPAILRKAVEYLESPPAQRVIGERLAPIKKYIPQKKRQPRRRKR